MQMTTDYEDVVDSGEEYNSPVVAPLFQIEGRLSSDKTAHFRDVIANLSPCDLVIEIEARRSQLREKRRLPEEDFDEYRRRLSSQRKRRARYHQCQQPMMMMPVMPMETMYFVAVPSHVWWQAHWWWSFSAPSQQHFLNAIM